ncbi:MAG: ATP synthase F1 subunit delta [Sedimentisphaerales bacterium]|nr:ATP synthase F1 subunit delta [Sedimentisphaerales bacterium]
MSTGTAAHLADIYARSLMDLAKQSQLVEAVAADFDTISTLLTDNPSFEAFLASPYFNEKTKRDVVRNVLTGSLQTLTLHFLFVMIDHNRGRLLPEIIGRYRQLYRVYQGYQTVEVTVAQPMSDEQVQKLSKELAEAMNARIDLDVHVDASILGGLIVRYGDQMVDNSVKGRLTRTVHQLLNPQKRQK